MKLRRLFSFSVAVAMLFAGMGTAFCSDAPTIEISFDGKNYEAGEIATGEIIVYNTKYNVLGFSIKYGDNVILVNEEGNEEENKTALVDIEDVMYRGEGIYSVLATDVTDEYVKTVVYVNPNTTDEDVKDNYVTVGGNGRKVATLSFKMTKDGIPDVNFATIAGDAEFSATPFIMLSEGVQPEGSIARIRYDIQEDEKENAKEDAKDETEDREDTVDKDDKKDEGSVNKEDTPENADKEKDDSGKEDEIIISSTLSGDDPTVTGDSGTDISHILPETESGDVENVTTDEQKPLTPLQRIMGICVLGLAFGITGGIFLKKVMDGARKED